MRRNAADKHNQRDPDEFRQHFDWARSIQITDVSRRIENNGCQIPQVVRIRARAFEVIGYQTTHQTVDRSFPIRQSRHQ